MGIRTSRIDTASSAEPDTRNAMRSLAERTASAALRTNFRSICVKNDHARWHYGTDDEHELESGMAQESTEML